VIRLSVSTKAHGEYLLDYKKIIFVNSKHSLDFKRTVTK